MVECTTCGQNYGSPLDAALCGDGESWETQELLVGVVFRSID